ncbi:hypothetical protein HZH68_009385 [Vespula germanica]|uniref:Uncharacterized protein n=1 Tax=Vespula germanica TaxID=30212 RepID=A0A834JWE0_VESGE|nr:hypothetical protein HZH68_009385 [Vespula germanica]
MKLIKFDFFFFLFYTITLIIGISTYPTEKPKESKRFVRFDQNVRMTSIINVPLHCPPDKVRIGNHCRSVF